MPFVAFNAPDRRRFSVWHRLSVFLCMAIAVSGVPRSGGAQEAMLRIPGPLDGRILSVTFEGQGEPIQLSERAILAGGVQTGLARVGVLSGPDGPLQPTALYAVEGDLPAGFGRCADGPAAFLALRRDKGSTALSGFVFEARPRLAMARGEGLCARVTLNTPLPPDPARAEPDPVDIAMVSTMDRLTPVANMVETDMVEEIGSAAPDPALMAGQLSHGLLAELDPYRPKLSSAREPEPAAEPAISDAVTKQAASSEERLAALAMRPGAATATLPDAAPGPDGGPAPEPVAQTPASKGAWRVIEARDARDLPQVALVLEASETLGGNGEQAKLVARCMGNQTALFAVWPKGFSGDARAGFLTERDVILQIDDARPESQIWELWPTQDATYAPGFPGDLLRSLQAAKQLTLRTANVAGGPLEARFDLAGLAGHLPVLAAPCRWTP
ncbi:hypothetical protein [Thioclava sp. GXIMD2076]|uniref:hypothetical protein n=1 Tax=Thioclava sp. GXIMD2076 TaxID=3131931 RepID=UPI0030CF8A96